MIGRFLFDSPLISSMLNRGPRATALAAVTLVCLIPATVGTIRTGRWAFRSALLLGAAVWPLPDHPFQGPVLFSLSYRHGVHLADLLSVLAAVVAVLPWDRRRPVAVRAGDPAGMSAVPSGRLRPGTGKNDAADE